jgi:hypothetical protein
MIDEVKAFPDDVLSIFDGLAVVCTTEYLTEAQLLMSFPVLPESTYHFPRGRESILGFVAKKCPC